MGAIGERLALQEAVWKMGVADGLAVAIDELRDLAHGIVGVLLAAAVGIQ